MFTQALGTKTTGFEGQWRFLADQQGLGLRHPSADLLPVFNASYRSLIDLVTSYGYTQFMTRGSTPALPTTPFEAQGNYATIDVGTSGTPGTPSVIKQIKKFDIRYTSGDWDTLPECTLLQLNDYANDSTPGTPRAWCWLNAGSVSTNTFVKGLIAVTPVPSGGSYALWTLNEFTDLTATTDVYLYHCEDWRQWHIYHAMSQVIGVRDKNLSKVLDKILLKLDPKNEGSIGYNIKEQAPTASGSRTWSRSRDYRGTADRFKWGR